MKLGRVLTAEEIATMRAELADVTTAPPFGRPHWDVFNISATLDSMAAEIEDAREGGAMIETLIAFAAQAHTGQRDKAGQPYIFHVLRVLLRVVEEHPDNATAHAAAVLHDVIEDTDLHLNDLPRHGVSSDVRDAVDVLTHRSRHSYFDYIRLCAAHPIARIVKRADIEDHLEDTACLTAAHIDRYQQARDNLRG